MGAPSASNSPSALSAQALRARALCAWAGKWRLHYWQNSNIQVRKIFSDDFFENRLLDFLLSTFCIPLLWRSSPPPLNILLQLFLLLDLLSETLWTLALVLLLEDRRKLPYFGCSPNHPSSEELSSWTCVEVLIFSFTAILRRESCYSLLRQHWLCNMGEHLSFLPVIICSWIERKS